MKRPSSPGSPKALKDLQRRLDEARTERGLGKLEAKRWRRLRKLLLDIRADPNGPDILSSCEMLLDCLET